MSNAGLSSEGSGATCLAHCDGSSTWTEIPLIVNAVTSRSNPAKDGRCRDVMRLFTEPYVGLI